ncbi:DUF494 domain-containing protein [Eikenella glucosivorans]
MMIDVIAFLLENFQDFDACPANDVLGSLLEEVGFQDEEIRDTLLFMNVLQERSRTVRHHGAGEQSMRVYLPEELEAVPPQALGLLHFLMQNGALSAEQREFVLLALMHLSAKSEEPLTEAHVKVLALLVLWADKSELPMLIGDDLANAVLRGQAVMN